MNKNKICKRCNQEILNGERAVLLRTFMGKEIIEDIYFHLSCYKEWHNTKATEKSKEQMKQLIGMSLDFVKKHRQDENRQHECIIC